MAFLSQTDLKAFLESHNLIAYVSLLYRSPCENAFLKDPQNEGGPQEKKSQNSQLQRLCTVLEV